jgi:hypothetical protein
LAAVRTTVIGEPVIGEPWLALKSDHGETAQKRRGERG